MKEIGNKLDTEGTLNEVSPQKEAIYESPNPQVLIGFVPTDEHSLCFENSGSPFYYSGHKKPSKFGFNNLKYFAPYIKGKGICHFFEILSYDIVERNRIFKSTHPLYKNETDERLVIHLGKKIEVKFGKYLKLSDGKIGQSPYRYTRLKNIRDAKNKADDIIDI